MKLNWITLLGMKKQNKGKDVNNISVINKGQGRGYFWPFKVTHLQSYLMTYLRMSCILTHIWGTIISY